MRTLGSRGPAISVLGYGAWVTGADTATASLDASALERAVATALELGITWFDTAEIYADGRSEELLGRALRPVRDDVAIVTKVAPRGAGTGMRPEDLGLALRRSLRRLSTDRVELYLLHWHDPTVPLEETWGAMAALREAGLARAVGVSNFGAELIERCRNVAPVDAVENQLSLLHRADEALAARVGSEGIAYLAYGVLAFGLLSGRIGPGTRFRPTDWRSGAFARYESNYYDELFAPGSVERAHAFVAELAGLAEQAGVQTPVLALAWVLERPGVAAAVLGTTNVEHLRVNASAGIGGVDAETVRRVDELVSRITASPSDDVPG